MTLRRLPDWPARLSAFVAARRGVAFAWGENDCVLFAADAVLAITGRDLALSVRGSYASAGGALRTLEPLGGLEAAATSVLGAPLAGCLARVGDVCLLQMNARPALGICNGTSVLGPGMHGIEHGPLSAALRCWRVG